MLWVETDPSPSRSLVQGLNLSDPTGAQCLCWASPLFFSSSGDRKRGVPGGNQSPAGSHQGHHPSRGGDVSLPKAGTKLSTQPCRGASCPLGPGKNTFACEKHLHRLQRGWASRAPRWWPRPGASVRGSTGHVGAAWPRGCWAAPARCQRSLSARSYYSPILPPLPESA